MSGNGAVRLIRVINAIEVAFEPFLYAVECWSNILGGTRVATDTIYQVIAVAGDVCHHGVFVPRGVTDDMT